MIGCAQQLKQEGKSAFTKEEAITKSPFDISKINIRPDNFDVDLKIVKDLDEDFPTEYVTIKNNNDEEIKVGVLCEGSDVQGYASKTKTDTWLYDQFIECGPGFMQDKTIGPYSTESIPILFLALPNSEPGTYRTRIKIILWRQDPIAEQTYKAELDQIPVTITTHR